ncbi:ornithine carbamoyltransferase [Klebsiella pneumoniae]|nr:ornithine carbamoyltransferase [Klebsiella pneumoniae]
MEDEEMNHNEIMSIIEKAMKEEYQYGKNDCNIVALRIVDLLCGTEWSKIANYKSLKTGLEQLNNLGFDSTQDIIIKECKEVEIPIDGDIWLDDHNPLIMGVVVSGRLLGVNESHDAFELHNKKKNGKYYRGIKKWDQVVEYLEH